MASFRTDERSDPAGLAAMVQRLERELDNVKAEIEHLRIEINDADPFVQVEEAGRKAGGQCFGGGGWPWGDDFTFGLGISGSAVTIYNPSFQIGVNAPVTIADQVLTVEETGTPIYVYAFYKLSDGSFGVTYRVGEGPNWADTEYVFMQLYILDVSAEGVITLNHENINRFMVPTRMTPQVQP